MFQQQLHQQGLPHTHPPGVSLPHPGLPPPHLPPGTSSGLLALSNALSSAPHLPVKEEKDSTLRESPLPPRGPLYTNRNATDSHSSHGSDDGREREQEYNRKMLGFEKRDSLPLPGQPGGMMDGMGGLHSSKPPPPHSQGAPPLPSQIPPPPSQGGPPGGLTGPNVKPNSSNNNNINNSNNNNSIVKKKEKEKDESDHEKSDAELVVDDTTENVSRVYLICRNLRADKFSRTLSARK